jgi:tetratricopeptide (TPR) repeat protein
MHLYRIYLRTGEYDAAIQEAQKREEAAYHTRNESSREQEDRATYFAKERETYKQLGTRKYLEYAIGKDMENAGTPRDPSLPYGWAELYALLGEKEKALDNLEKAHDNRAFMMAWVKANPIFDPLRSEPRYQAILKKMGL